MEPLSALWPSTEISTKFISIYDGADAFLSDYASAPAAHGVVFAAYWLQAEVLNGGLEQFYSNSTGVLAPEAVKACEVLQMPRLATKLKESMAWFGEPYPREREDRQAMLTAAGASGLDPFSRLDQEVADLIYDEGVGLEASALDFVRHRAGRNNLD